MTVPIPVEQAMDAYREAVARRVRLWGALEQESTVSRAERAEAAERHEIRARQRLIDAYRELQARVRELEAEKSRLFAENHRAGGRYGGKHGD